MKPTTTDTVVKHRYVKKDGWYLMFAFWGCGLWTKIRAAAEDYGSDRHRAVMVASQVGGEVVVIQ